MPTSTHQRHQTIALAVRRDAGAAVNTPALWQQLADQLTPIIGNSGFNALYLRSLHMARTAHGWLPQHDLLPTSAALSLLQQALRQHDEDDASAASITLLNTFIDTLILLIGELLTSSILREAWGDDVMNYPGTELPQ